MGKKRFQRHFRRVRDKEIQGHPVYVFNQDRKDYVFVGITKSPRTDGIDNLPLEKNPNRNNKKEIIPHVKPYASSLNKEKFSNKLKNWSFAENDKRTVDSIIDDYKKGKRKEDFVKDNTKRTYVVSKKSKKYKKKKGKS